MSEEAKAVQEVAKLASKALDSSEKAGGWLTEVFGAGFRNIGDAFADTTAGWKFRNRLKVLQQVQHDIDESKLAGKTRPLPDRLAVPLLEAISLESDDTLQSVWAAYIRYAIDPEQPKPDRVLIEVIQKLEPYDWPVLTKLFSLEPKAYKKIDFGLDDRDLVSILDRLTWAGLLTYDDDETVYIVGSPTVDKRRLAFRVGTGEYTATKVMSDLRHAPGH